MDSLLEILRKYLPDERVEDSPGDLITEIKRHHLLPTGLRLTNRSPGEEISLGSMRLGFDYKRELLRITGPARFPGYPFRTDAAYFLNSGQAGILVMLLHLRSLGIRNIRSPFHQYDGAERAAKATGMKFGKGRSRVLWICSAYADPSVLDGEDSFDHVVIDTTCWASDEKLLQKLVKRFSASTLYFIRSVSKLDMAGGEYGSLGTLAVKLMPRKQKKDLLQSLESQISLSSAAPSLDDIPPYLFDAAYVAYTLKRAKKITENSRKLSGMLRKRLRGTRIEMPWHAKYVFVFLPGSSEASAEKWKNHFRKALLFADVPAECVPSFGFDSISYSLNVDEKIKQTVLRICPGTDTEEVERLAVAVETLMNMGKLQ